MVVGGALEIGVTSQMLVANPPSVIPSEIFQGNFVGLSLGADTLTNQESADTLTNQETTLLIPTIDPFRRVQDTPTAATDVPIISHIGVFTKGDSTEDAVPPQHARPECVSDQYQSGCPDSPLVPMPEWGAKRQQALVGVVGGEKPRDFTTGSSDVSYSLECTEVRVWWCD
jgi:hypothetical protein